MANLQQAYGLGSLHHLDEDAVLFPTEHHHPAEGQDA
jgi:hypothetical protein